MLDAFGARGENWRTGRPGGGGGEGDSWSRGGRTDSSGPIWGLGRAGLLRLAVGQFWWRNAVGGTRIAAEVVFGGATAKTRHDGTIVVDQRRRGPCRREGVFKRLLGPSLRGEPTRRAGGSGAWGMALGGGSGGGGGAGGAPPSLHGGRIEVVQMEPWGGCAGWRWLRDHDHLDFA